MWKYSPWRARSVRYKWNHTSFVYTCRGPFFSTSKPRPLPQGKWDRQKPPAEERCFQQPSVHRLFGKLHFFEIQRNELGRSHEPSLCLCSSVIFFTVQRTLKYLKCGLSLSERYIFKCLKVRRRLLFFVPHGVSFLPLLGRDERETTSFHVHCFLIWGMYNLVGS